MDIVTVYNGIDIIVYMYVSLSGIIPVVVRDDVISPPAGEWSSPNITGQPPPPCYGFTLTPVGERKAALFGGVIRSGDVSDDLFIVELNRDTVVSVIDSLVRITQNTILLYTYK